MTRLHINMLGPFQVKIDETTADFRTDALRVLLAYLAAHQGRPLRRDSLAALLSPDRPNQEALTYLRNRLTRLRSAIKHDHAAPPWLDIDRKQIALRMGEDVVVDVFELERLLHTVESHPHRTLAGCPTCLEKLDAAAKLMRGEFLEGLNFPRKTWEVWLLAQREHIQQRALTGLTWLREARLVQREWAAGITIAHKQLRLDPYLEGAHRAIMQGQAALGDRTAALGQYALCKQVLWDELGVEPETETVALFETLKNTQASSLISHLSPFQTNLPAEMGRLVGREAEQTALLARLVNPRYRLVTLVGAGGVGKTHLATAVGWQVQNSFADGVWQVSLADMAEDSTAEQVQTAVGEVLGLNNGEKQVTTKQIINHLRSQQCLLIFDNCENVLDALEFIPTWLKRAPEVAILATSREPLNLTGEAVVALAGLPLSTAETLFVERAQMACADFTLHDDNAAQVRYICQLLDGLPLGIALAAAWVRRRSLMQIGVEIGRSLDFLTSRWRDVDPRHRNMRAVLETSWQLLTAAEQTVLAALAVFPATFSREAAQAIAGASLLDLDRLGEKSLLQQEPESEQYQLPGLMRQFAAEKLGDGAQRTAVERQFVTYFYNWAQAHKNHYDQLHPEWINVDTAVAIAHRWGDGEPMLKMMRDESWWQQAAEEKPPCAQARQSNK